MTTPAPASNKPHGITEAHNQRKVLEALPELWQAMETAFRTEAASSGSPWAQGQADALKTCREHLQKALPDSNDYVQVARGLLLKFFHPSRLGTVPDSEQSTLQVACDTVLARVGRAAAGGDLQ